MTFKKCYFRSLNSTGFGLLESVLATMLVSIVLLLGFTAFVQMQAIQAQSALLLDSNLLRKTLVSLLNTEASWAGTLAENSSMECVLNDQTCATIAATGNYTEFKVYKDAATVFFEKTAETSGLNFAGSPCNAYAAPGASGTDGNLQCPFQLKAEWRPLCSSADCIRPQIEIRLTFNPSLGKNGYFVSKTMSKEIVFQRGAKNDPLLNPVQSDTTRSANWTTSGGATVVSASGALDVSNGGAFSAASSLDYNYFITPQMDLMVTFIPSKSDATVNANNKSEVCITVSGICAYTWIQDKNSFSLWENQGGVMTQVLPATNFPEDSRFQLRVSRGKVLFYQDESLLWFFSVSLKSPYKFRVTPNGTGGGFIGGKISLL